MLVLSQILFTAFLHSIWQGAILYLLWTLFTYNRSAHPAYKKNLSQFLVFSQWVSFLFTCLYLFYSPRVFYTEEIVVPLPFGTAPIFMFIYLSFFTWRLIRIGFGWQEYRTISNPEHFLKAPAALRLFLEKTAGHTGLQKKVRLFISERVSVPVTFGFLKPVILLPVCYCNPLRQEEAEMMILHELAHIRSHDYLWNWLLLITDAFFWFNPFILALNRQTRIEREKNSDCLVLDFQYDPVTYARSLWLLAGANSKYAVSGIAATGHNGNLYSRILFFSTRYTTIHHHNRYIASILRITCCLALALPLYITTFHTGLYAKEDNQVAAVNQLMDPAPAAIAFQTTASVNRQNLRRNKPEPSIHKAPVNKLGPTRPVENVNDLVSAEPENSMPEAYQMIPVNQTETAEQTMNFYIRDENPQSGLIVTRAYEMRLQNGILFPVFLWMTTEEKFKPDSVQIKEAD